MIGFEFRFHPARATLRRMLARGDLGVPQLVFAADALPLYVAPYKAPPDWWYDAEGGGGWLGASGSHLIDTVRYWLGDARSITATVETLGRGSADDTFAMLVRLRSGAQALLHQSAAVLGPRFQALRVSGSEGTAWLDEDWALWHVGRRGEPARVEAPADLRLPEVEIPAHSGPFAQRELPSFVRLAEAFGDAILDRTRPHEAPVPATFGDGLACQRLMDAARDASHRGVWIDLPT
jgi:predicted dehydrogenase